jgi:hypothetical protein
MALSNTFSYLLLLVFVLLFSNTLAVLFSEEILFSLTANQLHQQQRWLNFCKTNKAFVFFMMMSALCQTKPACLTDRSSETDGVRSFDRERILVTKSFCMNCCSSFGLSCSWRRPRILIWDLTNPETNERVIDRTQYEYACEL